MIFRICLITYVFQLCYVLLFGLGMCYAMTFVMVVKPNFFTCLGLRAGLGLSLSICYAALVTKTNRISRIFNRGAKGGKRTTYTSPQSQLVICSSLVSIQMVGAMVWLVIEQPGTQTTYPDRHTVVLRCRSSQLSIVTSLLYNMFLIVLCMRTEKMTSHNFYRNQTFLDFNYQRS